MIHRSDPSSSPWCSRANAASYLGYEDATTVDHYLVDSEAYVPGKIRRRIMATANGRRTVRLWVADVLAMLKPFED